MNIKLLYKDTIIPTRANETDSGIDVYANNVKKHYEVDRDGHEFLNQISKFPICLKPNERILIGTGISGTYGKGFEIQARPRSGMAIKNGITVLNSPGTIDNDYRGEISIILINHSHISYWINKDDKIAQLVVCPVILSEVVVVDDLNETERGTGGFGSTGK